MNQAEIENLATEFQRRLPVIDRLAAEDDSQERAAGFGTKVTTTDVQTIQAQKTMSNAPFRVTDSSGVLIHAFGTKV